MQGFALEQMGIGPDDARKARLVAGSAVARLDQQDSGRIRLRRRRQGDGAAPEWCDARRVPDRQGHRRRSGLFRRAQQQPRGPPPVRRHRRDPVGRNGQRMAGGQDERDRLALPLHSVAVDRSFGRNWLSSGISRLEEKQTLLGGRMTDMLGGGGATRLFLDADARHDFGGGWRTELMARRGWTDFAAGKFESGGLRLRCRQARRAWPAPTASACGSLSRCASSMAASR